MNRSPIAWLATCREKKSGRILTLQIGTNGRISDKWLNSIGKFIKILNLDNGKTERFYVLDVEARYDTSLPPREAFA